MNIHEAAKKLRKLGIPGKEKEKAIKKNLVTKEGAHLEAVLLKPIEKTLVRWAYTQKVIDPPEEPEGQGRSQMSDWPPETVEQAAAVWAVRAKWREIHSGKKKRLSSDRINAIKRAASVLDERPFAVYTPPTVTGPLSAQRFSPEHIKIEFVSEDCEELDFFQAEDNAKKAECLNKLVVAWIAAVEKVRAWQSIGLWTCIVKYYPDLADLTPDKVDFSQIDPWLVDVPCPWRIDKSARIALFWNSRPSKNKESRVFWKPPFPFQRKLSESDHDEIVLYENYIDTRKFFKIDSGDREEAKRTELETIERELKENLCTLQSMNLDIYTTRVETITAIAEKPVATRTKYEKQALEAFSNVLDLVKRRELLKTQ